MEIITNNYQSKPRELTAEQAVSHMFGVDENHVEQVEDYLITIHTEYLAREGADLTESYLRECNFYFIQLRLILKTLKKMERQREAEMQRQNQNTPAA
ncbi:hypothetical protein OB13_20360 [Pontibacter sp. HJ8]